jgi:hypothetical protein
MLRTVFLPLLCALMMAAPGCSYFQRLRKDAAETLHVAVGASTVPGLFARVQVPVLSSSAGWLPHATYVGTDYGYVFIWQEAAAGIVVGGQMVRTDVDADIETYWTSYLPDAYLDQAHYLVLTVVATDERTALGGKQSIPYSKVEAGVHVLFIGAQLGVDYVQFLDLLTGVFGWDMLGDDEFRPSPPESQEQLEDDQAFRVIERVKAIEQPVEMPVEEAPDAPEPDAEPPGGSRARR